MTIGRVLLKCNSVQMRFLCESLNVRVMDAVTVTHSTQACSLPISHLLAILSFNDIFLESWICPLHLLFRPLG